MLRIVKGGLQLWGNPRLARLDGLKNLFSVGGNLKIHGNKKLRSCCGFYGVREIARELLIVQNEALETFYGSIIWHWLMGM
jgi:hypothetical protein